MIEVKIICIGKLKEKYWSDASFEYVKRLKPFCNLEIIELPEERIGKKARGADIDIVKIKEGEAILSKVRESDYVVTLEIMGKELSSKEMSGFLIKLMHEGKTKIDFIIGGSYGLSSEVSNRADFKLSFSKMTFPHQMMRVILLEQLYRSFMIDRGAPYHK